MKDEMGKGLEGNNVPKRVFFGGEKVNTEKASVEHGKRGKRIKTNCTYMRTSQHSDTDVVCKFKVPYSKEKAIRNLLHAVLAIMVSIYHLGEASWKEDG
jgi:hypothetical protein